MRHPHAQVESGGARRHARQRRRHVVECKALQPAPQVQRQRLAVGGLELHTQPVGAQEEAFAFVQVGRCDLAALAGPAIGRALPMPPASRGPHRRGRSIARSGPRPLRCASARHGPRSATTGRRPRPSTTRNDAWNRGASAWSRGGQGDGVSGRAASISMAPVDAVHAHSRHRADGTRRSRSRALPGPDRFGLALRAAHCTCSTSNRCRMEAIASDTSSPSHRPSRARPRGRRW